MLSQLRLFKPHPKAKSNTRNFSSGGFAICIAGHICHDAVRVVALDTAKITHCSLLFHHILFNCGPLTMTQQK